jgi:hypothetical protein
MKKIFGWSGVYFIFILHLYITVTCRHTIVCKIVWSKRCRYGHNPTDSSHIMTQRCFMLCTTYTHVWFIVCPLKVRCLTPLSGRGRMILEFTTTCAIIAYHHLSCEFEPHSCRGVLDKTSVNCRHNVRHIRTIHFLLPSDWDGWPLNSHNILRPN